MPIFLFIIFTLGVLVYLFIRLPQFGRLPSGERLQKIQRSVNYKNGSFSNLSHTPAFTNGATVGSILLRFIFGNTKRMRPVGILPSVKTNLHNLPAGEDVLVWFGHSSYFMQVAGKKILVDPVLSGSASPLPGGTRAFEGTDIYKPADIPAIDFLFISHDHWDHLDYETIKALQPTIKEIICPLGVGAHFEYWGFDSNNIYEKDWGESVDLGDGFLVTLAPARHFSGRSLQRNKSLWASFVLQTPSLKIFMGGDSGYDDHFKTIGQQHGPFDLAIFENGQYDQSWKHIHLMPGEIFKAAEELQAKRILPVHSGKFKLGNHAWDEPLQNVWELKGAAQLPTITPMIGEVVDLNNPQQLFGAWWQGIE